MHARVQSLVLKDELKARMRVLRRLGYCDEEGLVSLKGRAAAEVQCADELVIAEMIFSGAFQVWPQLLDISTHLLS